jgi:hypothetical protein
MTGGARVSSPNTRKKLAIDGGRTAISALIRRLEFAAGAMSDEMNDRAGIKQERG